MGFFSNCPPDLAKLFFFRKANKMRIMSKQLLGLCGLVTLTKKLMRFYCELAVS